MRIQFNTDNHISGTANVAERVENHLRERLGRFEERLTRLEVHVNDINGPGRGGEDKRCTIEARPRNADPLTVSGQASDVDAAVRDASAKMVSVLDSFFGKADRHPR